MTNTFRISQTEVEVIFGWLTYLEQARVALELENAGHDAICLTVQKTAEAIFKILRELPPA